MAKLAIRRCQVSDPIRPKKRTPVAPLLTALGPVIYAMKTRDGYLKIGHTSDLAARRQYFGGFSDILAWRSGTVEDEQAIHTQLDGLAAVGREYYLLTQPEVLVIVNAWRADLGIQPLGDVNHAH